jgi:hypothetical protein
VESNYQIYREFLRTHLRTIGKSAFEDSTPPTDEEKHDWRLWMTTVFMPTNRRLYELVVTQADLLIEEDVPAGPGQATRKQNQWPSSTSDAMVQDPKGLGRPVEEHGELELGCWAGEDRRLIAITEF